MKPSFIAGSCCNGAPTLPRRAREDCCAAHGAICFDCCERTPDGVTAIVDATRMRYGVALPADARYLAKTTEPGSEP